MKLSRVVDWVFKLNLELQEVSRSYQPSDHYRGYQAPVDDPYRSKDLRPYSSRVAPYISSGSTASSAISSSSFRSGGVIRSSEAPPPNKPKGDLRDMDLQEVILSKRPGARRGPPPPWPAARGGGPSNRSRATQDVLDAAMDDYWKTDDGDPAPVHAP